MDDDTFLNGLTDEQLFSMSNKIKIIVDQKKTTTGTTTTCHTHHHPNRIMPSIYGRLC